MAGGDAVGAWLWLPAFYHLAPVRHGFTGRRLHPAWHSQPATAATAAFAQLRRDGACRRRRGLSFFILRCVLVPGVFPGQPSRRWLALTHSERGPSSGAPFSAADGNAIVRLRIGSEFSPGDERVIGGGGNAWRSPVSGPTHAKAREVRDRSGRKGESLCTMSGTLWRHAGIRMWDRHLLVCEARPTGLSISCFIAHAAPACRALNRGRPGATCAPSSSAVRRIISG